tara:strand:- start:2424 stop:2759 length:336 start_codon:yes stop_codon:yes gene_type:complete
MTTTPTTNTFDISAMGREGISLRERSRVIRGELQRLLTDLMKPGAQLSSEAMQQRISDAEWFLVLFDDYLGETLPGPPTDEDEDEDEFDYDDDDAHAPANNDQDPRPVRLS